MADGKRTPWEPKKAVSLAFDDWLVFARRGLISRVQVVMAGYYQTPLEEVVPTIPGTAILALRRVTW
jgi:hypothetical protein